MLVHMCQYFYCAASLVFTLIHAYMWRGMPTFAFAEVGCNCNKSLSDLGFI